MKTHNVVKAVVVCSLVVMSKAGYSQKDSLIPLGPRHEEIILDTSNEYITDKAGLSRLNYPGGQPKVIGKLQYKNKTTVLKTGLWVYFDEKSRIIREEYYDEKGKLINTSRLSYKE